MKKIFFTSIALALLVSCNKNLEINAPVNPEGNEFELKAFIGDETKTAFGKDFKTVTWEEGDALNVFLQKGTEKSNIDLSVKFNKTAGEDTFHGRIKPNSQGKNTYYALYPYSAEADSIEYTSKGTVINGNASKADRLIVQTPVTENGERANYGLRINPGTQEGINNMDHIHVPMIGSATVDGEAIPAIKMKHIAAIFKVSVYNTQKEAMTVSSIKFTSDDPKLRMTGSFRLNFEPTADYPLLDNTTTSHTSAELQVTNGKIESGKVGDFYVMTRRLKLAKEKKITITVTLSDNTTIQKVIAAPVDKAMQFNEGTIHRIHVCNTVKAPCMIDFRGMNRSYFPFLESTDLANPIKEGLKLKKSTYPNASTFILKTEGGANELVFNAFECNINGSGKVILKVSGSKDKVVWTPLTGEDGITDLPNIDLSETIQANKTTVKKENGLTTDMKYFKFESFTPEVKENETGCNKSTVIESIAMN